jgi:Phosphotransferase enzyme family
MVCMGSTLSRPPGRFIAILARAELREARTISKVVGCGPAVIGQPEQPRSRLQGELTAIRNHARGGRCLGPARMLGDTVRMPAADQTAQIGRITGEGLAAARKLARRLGLPCAEPDVLSSRRNLLLHLAPAPIVSRVATLTAWTRRDPAAWLAREVAVAAYAAGRGGPVARPASTVAPGPYWQDGHAISLWDYLPRSPLRPRPAEVGAALARLHQAAAGCPADLGDLSPAREQVSEGLDALERDAVLDRATITALRAGHARALANLPDTGRVAVLHGDAHAGNLLAADDGWRWIDLEETCRGPVGWDLAALASHSGPDAEVALGGNAAASGCPVQAADVLAPFRRARLLEAAVWTLCMAHQYPARYRDGARDLLAAALRL